MNIQLTHDIPSQDGYYLMKFNCSGGLHLVLIQTQIDKTRVIIPQSHNKKQISIQINDNHGPLLSEAYYSIEPIIVTLV
jgi:hypothetical protein